MEDVQKSDLALLLSQHKEYLGKQKEIYFFFFHTRKYLLHECGRKKVLKCPYSVEELDEF